MNCKTLSSILIIGCLIAASPEHVAAQGTAFTYQGRLTESGIPANGRYDLRSVLSDLNGTALLGGPLTNASVLVTNGLFTIDLDFGALTPISGLDAWLEIGVRTNGSASAYTVLS